MTEASTLSAIMGEDRTAVITGGASGIGFAVANRLAAMRMNVVIADLGDDRVGKAAAELGNMAAGEIVGVSCDVSRPEEMLKLAESTRSRFGPPSFLMNNAGIGMNPGKPWENLDRWRQLIDVNFWGAVNGVQAFLPSMLAAGAPAIVVNTGSKQGITTPPGNYAYNVSKSALKTYTEGLAHELRNTPDAKITPHLLIPGFTFTGITEGAMTKPAAAWSANEVADYMLAALDRGDFYILCADNETPRELDEKRMLWAAGDIVENRPALSRWHPDYKEKFAAFIKG